MSELNPEQYAAMTYIDGPLLVIAGAGSGKTRVITQKIAYLIQVCHLQPKNIYAVTFTNKAAKEMSERIQQLLRNSAGKVHVSTFHSLGLDIIRREAAHLNLTHNLTLFDATDSLHLLKELTGKIAAVSEENLKSIQHVISNWKNALISPEYALSTANDETTHLAARFYNAYASALHAYNAVDFDDLILLPAKLFQENPAVLEHWQNKVRYLLVDEYQDTNTVQYQFIKLLCGVRGALTVVGDDDQSIYAWRGAKVENISLLQQDYPNLRVIKLEQNYRSTRIILRAANHLISHNPHIFDKKLWSMLEEGEPIRVIATPSGEGEVERVVHELLAHKFRHRLNFNDYAILYRSNHQARSLEQLLRMNNVPYQITGGTSFFARTEIKDLFAYFRLMVNHKDDSAFLRCVNTPKRDIGPVTLEKLGLYAKERQCSLFDACYELGLREWLPENAYQRLYSFVEQIQRVFAEAQEGDCLQTITEFVTDIRYYDYLKDIAPNPNSAQKRIDNVQELLAWLGRLVKEKDKPLSFEEAINKMILLDMIDRGSEEKTGVQLMTLHAAKGLEFPHVYILGWEEETLPHKNSSDEEAIYEERRLAYVGMTRAQKSLVLTYAKQRKRFNENQAITASRFLAELPQDLLEWEGHQAQPVQEQQARGQAHLANLRAMLQEKN